MVDSRLAALAREGKLEIGATFWQADRGACDGAAALLPTLRVSAGDKVRVTGAETNEGGQQMEALEATKSSLLRISYNNTHR